MAATTGNDREARLEAALADANRQLLERDDELISIARDEELQYARDTLQAFERRLKRYARDIEQLNRAIAEMQSTRVWRFGVWLRVRRDRLRRLFPKRG